MAAEIAAMPFKNKEADTAVLTGKCSKTNSGEKIRPPPKPTMVRIKEAVNIRGKRINKDIWMMLLSFYIFYTTFKIERQE